MTFQLKKENIKAYWILTRMHKPIGSLLLLWPMYWALWIASEGQPDGLVFIVFTLGVVLMRSAGCVINDYADRQVDPHVSRTKDRPIASGQVKPSEALQLFFVLITVSAMLVLLMNTLTIWLSWGAVLLASLYPYMKRHTHLPQVFLGMAFGWAVPMVFAAQLGNVPIIAWLVFIATVIWAVIYDTMYAMVDREDDLSVGIKSTAILFGSLDVRIIGLLQCLCFVAFWRCGVAFSLGPIYYAAVSAVGILFARHLWLIRDRDIKQCFAAFNQSKWIGLIILMGLCGQFWIGASSG